MLIRLLPEFHTGNSAVPPIIHLSPAKEITDTNATIGYDPISYDGVRPEVILYWGSFDHGSNSGLWENSQSLGTREVGSGEFQIGGLTAGKEVFFRFVLLVYLLKIGRIYLEILKPFQTLGSNITNDRLDYFRATIVGEVGKW